MLEMNLGNQDASSAVRKILLKRLDETVAHLIEVYQCIVPAETEVDDGWTANEILGHITFWHESFARNLSALTSGRKPTPLKGLYVDLNRRSVEEMKGLTAAQIVERLCTAHQVIQRDILSPSLTLIPYRRGSRDYTPEEHLQIVNGHIAEHLKSIEIYVQECRDQGARRVDECGSQYAGVVQ